MKYTSWVCGHLLDVIVGVQNIDGGRSNNTDHRSNHTIREHQKFTWKIQMRKITEPYTNSLYQRDYRRKKRKSYSRSAFTMAYSRSTLHHNSNDDTYLFIEKTVGPKAYHSSFDDD